MAWGGLVQQTGKYRSIRHMEYPKFQTGIFGRMESAPSLSFTKKVHYVIVCEVCGLLRKRNLILICAFRSNLVLRGFSRQYRHGQMRQFVLNRRLDFGLRNNSI